MQKIRQHLSEPELQGLRTVFTLRATAQQVDNTISVWMAGPWDRSHVTRS